MGKKTFMKKLPLLSSICWREIFFHLVHLAHTAFSFINYFIDFITCEIDLRKIAQGSKFEKSGHLQNFKITFIESVLLYRQYVLQNEELMSNIPNRTFSSKQSLSAPSLNPLTGDGKQMQIQVIDLFLTAILYGQICSSFLQTDGFTFAC